jgi:hypothetical protein
MNDELKDPALPPPAGDAAPAPTAVPVAESAAPIDAKPPEAMPVIFNAAPITPNDPPKAGGPMAAARSGLVLVVMLGLGYFILAELGVMKPLGQGGADPAGTAAIMAKVQRDSLAADQEASAREQQRLHAPPPAAYPAPTLTVSAGMIGDRRSFPDPPPMPAASGSAKAVGKRSGLDEGQTLDLARAAIAKGDSTKALVILDGHDRDFAQGIMNPDAKVLRIEALARTGEDARAKELAEGFLADFPHSPLAPRTRGLLDAINRKMTGGAPQAP